MLETFINLVSVISESSKISEASMNASGLITIDGVTNSGERFYLNYRTEKDAGHADS